MNDRITHTRKKLLCLIPALVLAGIFSMSSAFADSVETDAAAVGAADVEGNRKTDDSAAVTDDTDNTKTDTSLSATDAYKGEDNPSTEDIASTEDANDVLEDIVEIKEQHFTCTFDGVKHDFIIDLPENPENSPLVIMLHGLGGTAETFRMDTGFHKDAVPEGYTVVYVTGAKSPGDKTASVGWNSGIEVAGNRDTAFLRTLVEWLIAEYHCDSGRVSAVGFSNGAFMMHRLAVEEGETFSSVVSVAGTIHPKIWEERPESLSTSVLQITGEKDNIVPKNSDGSAAHALSPAIEDVMAYYAEANGLSEEVSEAIGKESTLIKYTGDSSGLQVWHLIIKDGRHSWSAESVTGINTNQLILEFLTASSS